MKTVLIAGPVHQKKEILKEFLESLENLNHHRSIKISYCFFDDNNEIEAQKLIEQFSFKSKNTTIFKSEEKFTYLKDNYTHYWTNELINKVAEMKNYIIQYALAKQHDYLFLIDSDLVLHPNTLNRLLSAEKDIISNIFWTSWQPGTIEMPQVWLEDEYSMYKKQHLSSMSDEEIQEQVSSFLHQLRIPGVYEVGGLGACTLVSRKALQAGVNFSPIKNLSFWGEDRHFCIRAVALGFDLYVDTHHPAYHIYRSSDIKGVEAFKNRSVL